MTVYPEKAPFPYNFKHTFWNFKYVLVMAASSIRLKESVVENFIYLEHLLNSFNCYLQHSKKVIRKNKYHSCNSTAIHLTVVLPVWGHLIGKNVSYKFLPW